MEKDLAAAREARERYQQVQDALFVLGTHASFEESVRGVDGHVYSLADPLLVSLYRRLFREPHAPDLISPEEGFENWYRAFLGRLVEVAKTSAADLHSADMRVIASLGSGAARGMESEAMPGSREWHAGAGQEGARQEGMMGREMRAVDGPGAGADNG